MQTLPSVIISSCVASLVAIIAVYYASHNGNRGDHSNIHGQLSAEGQFWFKALDLDGDGSLSPHELAPVIEKLVGKPSQEESRQTVSKGETIRVKAEFKPLLVESLRSSGNQALPSFLIDDNVSGGLRNWTKVGTPIKTFNTLDFGAFLPVLKQVELGRTWSLYNPPDKEYKNNRYFPPMPSDTVAILSSLLRMFHPRPFMETRFAPRGAVALVRAQNDLHLDIAFRIHAEFQLNEPPSWPFWFTPAQFSGNVVIARDGGHVAYFHLYVPANRSLNVDMEWLTKDNELDMEVEIGYMPQMELESMRPSSNYDDGDHGKSSEGEWKDIVWKEEITWEEVAVELEKAMYPFKQLTYHPFESIFDRAKREKKLIHNIVLWGALDDQSC